MSELIRQSEQAVLDDVLSNDGYRSRARALRRSKARDLALRIGIEAGASLVPLDEEAL